MLAASASAGVSCCSGPRSLAQYIVRPPVSLQNLLVEEGGTDTVVYRAPYSDYFRTDTKIFPAVEFLVEVLQQICAYCRSSVPPLFVPSRFMEYVLGMPVS